jgi:uncharacterized repeat protein (TIGR03803 family)
MTRANYPGGKFVTKLPEAIALAIFLLFAVSLRAQNLTVLYSFAGKTDGGTPLSSLVRDQYGNLYGTTQAGGSSGNGTVFKLNGKGVEKVLHEFGGGSDGSSPEAGLVRDSQGNLYGTTAGGGTGGTGTVFKISNAGQYSVLYSFAGGNDGAVPQAPLFYLSGELYGTTAQGGAKQLGTAFQVNATTGGETWSYSFAGDPDGANPHAGLIAGTSGNLYGTTSSGGASNAGTVFQITTGGVETPLYSFAGGSDGADPEAGLIFDSNNNLYGTTNLGGSAGDGTVFVLDTSDKESVLYSFAGGNDGENPKAGLVINTKGTLYGTTSAGGKLGFGVVFKLTSANKETVLYTFKGKADGANPVATLIQDSAGNLYGTASQGGSLQHGTVFKLSPRVTKVLFGFSNPAKGIYPYGRVVQDLAGNTYGTTAEGGTFGYGTVFKVDPSNKETVLHSFSYSNGDGAYPYGGVVRDQAGNLFGVTLQGGTNGVGTVYKIDSSGTETILYSFTGQPDGALPYTEELVMDSAANLYGTTSSGGTYNYGTVFELSQSGVETVLWNFTGGSDGGSPYAGVILGTGGYLYGTAGAGGDLGVCGQTAGCGTVYKVDINNKVETPLWEFGQVGTYSDGEAPYGTVAQDNKGNLYGTTIGGGTYQQGTVFEIDTAGTETVLYSFGTGANDGVQPWAGLTLDKLGNLYGTTQYGGLNYGTAFVLNSSMQETILHAFTNGEDGAYPVAGLSFSSDGSSLLGTSSWGSANAPKYGCCRGATYGMFQ